MAWLGLVVCYYFVLLIPAALLLASLDPALYASFFGLPYFQAYKTMVVGTAWELGFTSLISTLLMAALPSRLTRPLW
jgi:hypothetical protein